MNAHSDYLDISSVEGLRGLLSFSAVFRRQNEVRLHLEGVDQKTTADWENRINRYYKACGCNEGKFFVFLFFLGFIVNSYVNHTLTWSWRNAGIGFLYCMAGAVAGKVYGLIIAWWNLRKVVRSILEQQANSGRN
jgi:hypothetical protein